MDKKIIIVIPVLIVISVLITFNLTQNQIFENKTEDGEKSEIQNILNKIEKDRKENSESENPYYPKEREWIQSGPFLLDRSEYRLGEKIFINLDNMNINTKGKMIFSKIINNTHNYEYKKLDFDGSKSQSNFYLGLTLNSARGLCNAEKLVGNWEVIFEGTDYKSIKFKVLEEILPGSEENYQPVC